MSTSMPLSIAVSSGPEAADFGGEQYNGCTPEGVAPNIVWTASESFGLDVGPA